MKQPIGQKEEAYSETGAAERKALAPVLVLTLGTKRIIPLFDPSERAGIDGVNIAPK